MDSPPSMGRMRVSDDVAAAAWIGPRLSSAFGAITHTVPGGYPAYARVLHPAADVEGRPATWAAVAQVTGRRVHAMTQWHALVGSPDPFTATGSLWPGSNPLTGDLEQPALSALIAVLAARTSTETAAACWFAHCTIAGTIGPAVPLPLPPTEHGAYASFRGHLSLEGAGPQVHLPGRDYLLMSGPLEAAADADRSPSLWWPGDRSWCVASEVDFDSTLVAGSRELVDALVAVTGLEVWEVQPADSLASDGDLVNDIP